MMLHISRSVNIVKPQTPHVLCGLWCRYMFTTCHIWHVHHVHRHLTFTARGLTLDVRI